MNTYRGWDSTKERTAMWLTPPEPQDQQGGSSFLCFDRTLLDEEAIESLLLQLPLKREGRLFFRWGVLARFSIWLATVIKHRHASAVGWKPSMQPQLVLESGGGFFCPCWFHFPDNSNTSLSLEIPFNCFLSCCACFALVNRHKERSFNRKWSNEAWRVIVMGLLDGRNVGWTRETISIHLNNLFLEWGGSCIPKRKIFPLLPSVPRHCTIMLLLTNYSEDTSKHQFILCRLLFNLRDITLAPWKCWCCFLILQGLVCALKARDLKYWWENA